MSDPFAPKPRVRPIDVVAPAVEVETQEVDDDETESDDD